jgi:3-hydroxymyristoyl/3-hydroxydecanoyl-(acyl carrier protein) dehydratase
MMTTMCRTTYQIASDHPATLGHFPGNPIVPGAVLLRIVSGEVFSARPGQRCVAVPAAKFLAPVRPGDVLEIDWFDAQADDIRFTCRAGGVAAITGTLRSGAG